MFIQAVKIDPDTDTAEPIFTNVILASFAEIIDVRSRGPFIYIIALVTETDELDNPCGEEKRDLMLVYAGADFRAPDGQEHRYIGTVSAARGAVYVFELIEKQGDAA